MVLFEGDNLLDLTVFADREGVLLKAGHGVSARVTDDDVDGDETGFNGDGRGILSREEGEKRPMGDPAHRGLRQQLKGGKAREFYTSLFPRLPVFRLWLGS
jgi:hypothetical protein